MKKAIAASIVVAGLSFALVSAAVGYTFSNYLSVGSTGADVVALQTWLMANGYSIPAIASGAASKGYFGSQTKAAVVKYQASVGLPSTGFVGPLTIAKLNGGASAPVAMGCPTGFICTPAAGTSPVVTAPAGTISTPGIAGTIAASLWTTPSGVTAYKGQAYDVAGYKLQASASDMAVSSVALDFDTRLWLYASSITLKDETGAVVGQISNLSAANFSELTVGSDYRVSVPTNFVVKATQSKYITVNINFLGVTDRTSTTITITKAQIRAVDGTGVTDTETISDARAFSYQSTNIAQLVVTTDPSSPASGVIQVSTAAQTMNVPLAVYDVKSQNQPATLQQLTIGLTLSSSTLPIGNLFTNVQIKAAGLTYSASSLSTTSASFTNLAIPLPADVYVPITITATLAQDTNNLYDNVYVTTNLNTSVLTNGTPTNLVAVDSTYNNIVSNSVTLTSNPQAFSAAGVTASNLTASNVTYNNNSTTAASSTGSFTMSWSLTAGNNPIYVSKTYGTAVTATTTGGLTFTSASFRDNDSTNDGTTYFYVAPGRTMVTGSSQ
jgi:peptidoglycan hydrolase-like protein with peptidoglycan-binding domain